MEASSTLENIRPPVVSRWRQKVNNCLRLHAELEYTVTCYIIEPSVDNLEHS